MITTDTIEDHMLKRSLQKKKLSDQVMEEGEEKEEGDVSIVEDGDDPEKPGKKEKGKKTKKKEGEKGEKGKGDLSLKDAQRLLARALLLSDSEG